MAAAQQGAGIRSVGGLGLLTRLGVQRSVGDMDKFAPWPKGIARSAFAGALIASVLIASVLAWALALQSASAASAGLDAAAVERCAADRGDHHRAPERHAACACCLPGRSGPFAGLEGLALAVAAPRPPIAGLLRLDLRPTLRPISPRGCIGSWSPRAPPRRDARCFSLRAREA